MKLRRLLYRKKYSSTRLLIYIICSIMSLSFLIIKYMINDIYKFSRWLINQWHFRHIEYSYWEIKKIINNMSPRCFEIFCCELFKANGFDTELTPPSNDYGRDMIISPNTDHEIYVEIKHYSEEFGRLIGREIVQKLIGSCIMFGVKEAIIITTGKIHKNAYECLEFLEDKDFTLTFIDMDDIMDMIKKTDVKKIPSIMAKSHQVEEPLLNLT